MSKTFLIFVLSVIAAATALACERAVGIGWDYHIDSVTYHTRSLIFVDLIYRKGILFLFNKGYFLIVAMLNESIIGTILYNIFLFAVTNVFIARLHWRNICARRKGVSFVLCLLLFNPYRLHLATTMLKDTTVIFLVIMMLYFSRSKIKRFFVILPMIIVRMASMFYIVAIAHKKYIKYIFIIFVILFIFKSDYVLNRLAISSEVDLQFRSFDRVSSFQQFGMLGSLLRGIVWPILALTGGFFFISPAATYLFVAVGCWANLLYTTLVFKKLPFRYMIVFSLFVFAVLVPGFTSYIRYVYPIVTVAPMLLTKADGHIINRALYYQNSKLSYD